MVRALGIVVVALVVAGACEGTWSQTANPSPVRAVHAALLRTGKVLLIAGSGNDPDQFAAGTFKTAIYDPTTDTMRSDISTPYDLFCAGHAFLPDGRLLVAGGTSAYQTDTTPYKGEKRVRIFDPVTEKYHDRAVDGDRPLVPDGREPRRRVARDGRRLRRERAALEHVPGLQPDDQHLVREQAARHLAERHRRVLAALPVDAPARGRSPLLLGRARVRGRSRHAAVHVERRRQHDQLDGEPARARRRPCATRLRACCCRRRRSSGSW